MAEEAEKHMKTIAELAEEAGIEVSAANAHVQRLMRAIKTTVSFFNKNSSSFEARVVA